MNWRILLGACAGLLLALPLMLLLGRFLQPEVATESPPGVRISPMLDHDQRMRLMTYRRLCRSSTECEPPLGCLHEYRYRRQYCTDSQCTMDAHCPEGQVCLKLATDKAGPLVRICIPMGVRQEGESCFKVPRDQKGACAPGLLCAGMNGWCSRPCRLGAPAECPEGFFCADTTPQPACLPTCEGRSCPANEQCIQLEEGSSTCVYVYGTNCQQSPCPENRRCNVFLEPPQPRRAWLECIERCGKDLPPCGAGKFCDDYQCVVACDPEGPDICPEGFRCQQPWTDLPFGCHPDW
jgi:hypothetical protein